MEELNKIIESVKDSVAKNVAMEEDFEKKAEELRDKCVDNYNTIISETLSVLHTLAKDLCNKYGVWFTDEENGTEHVLVKYYGNNRSGYIVNIKNEGEWFRPYYNTCNSEFRDDIRRIYSCKNDKKRIMSFADILSTEDKANALLSEICEVYAKLFTKVLEQVDEDNNILSGQLTSLKEYLNNSSVVKEEEDGTIEIHLNGKTYKGTLVEE